MSAEAESIVTEGFVGHFRIVGRLGRGGMGTVFVGLDENLGRRVALKVIRRDQRLDPVRKARFLREARVLAGLDHPNICQFHDYIEGSKSDCIVLELVDGRSLREALDEGIDHAAGMKIAEQLLDVLVAVHSKGIIHRDLKPENIMLTATGDIKVLDFGLARPVEDPESLSGEFHAARATSAGETLEASEPGGAPTVREAVQDPTMTAFGTVLGTVGYMSPEVARGEPATAASDLFSAGMILQEIFTGRCPIPTHLPAHERHRRSMWGEVESPDRLSSELATLIRRMQSLVPENRPTAIDAAAMLQAIRRRPALRRRRLLIGAVWVVLALFGTGMSIQYVRAEREARRAEREAATAREVSDFLVGLFEHASPRLGPGEELSVEKLLESGAETIDGTLERQPEVRARLLHTLGLVYYHLGRYGEAEPLLSESLELRRKLLDADDPELVESLAVNGLLNRRLGRYDRAEELFLEELRAARLLAGEGSPMVARALIDLSGIEQDRGRWAAAEPPLLQAVSILEASPDGLAAGLTDALFELATVYRKTDRLDEASAALERCLDLDEAEHGPRSHEVAADYAELAALELFRGDAERAESLARRSLEIRMEVFGERHSLVAHSATTLGSVLAKQGRFDEAEDAYLTALDVYRAAYGDGHPYVGSVLHSLGGIAASRGELDRAATLFEDAIEVTATGKGEEHPWVADSMQRLAAVRCRQGRTAEAMELFKSALAVLEPALGRDHPTTVEARENYEACLSEVGPSEHFEKTPPRAAHRAVQVITHE